MVFLFVTTLTWSRRGWTRTAWTKTRLVGREKIIEKLEALFHVAVSMMVTKRKKNQIQQK
ncbi:MAG: hypothetical protein RSA99_01225 [Oscillospiraceae bacterium]